MKKTLFMLVIVATLLIVKPGVYAFDWSDVDSPITYDYSLTVPNENNQLQVSTRFKQDGTYLYRQIIIGQISGSNQPLPFNTANFIANEDFFMGFHNINNSGIYSVKIMIESEAESFELDLQTKVGFSIYNDSGIYSDEFGFNYNDDITFFITVDYRTQLTAFNNQEYYNWGFVEGQQEGYNRGRADGLANGEDYWKEFAHVEGYEEAREYYGYRQGNDWITANEYGALQYDEGYYFGDLEGYSRGQIEDFNGLTILTSGLFGFISVIGNVQLLPGFKVGHIVGITMFFGLIYFIIGKAGGKK